MNNKHCIFLSGVAALVTLPSFAQSKGASEKPMNILYIMSDDHSFQTISAYDHRFIETPNIDRIGNEGVVFTNSFVANSISGPSRACMLTGKHSHKNGFIDNAHRFDGSQQTFPKLLQKAGYQTAIVGKWHLTSNPTGFDYWNILIGQGDYYNPYFIDNGKKVQIEGYATNITTDLALEWLENKREKEKPFCLLLHHKAPHRTWMPDTCDLGAFDKVKFPLPENFYDKYEGRIAASEQEMNIFKDMDLVYDLKMADKENEIHTKTGLEGYGRAMYKRMNPQQKAAWDAYYDPIIKDFKARKLEGKELAEWKYQRYMHDYLSVIRSVDRNIGRVLKYLEEKGLLENTLVVYTSDQGFYMGEHGWFDKRFMYEESFRTPLLARFPHGKKGKVSQMVQNIDYAPTFLEMAGVDIPEDIQGVSLLPLLKGERPKDWRKSLYYHFYEYPAEHAVKRHYGVRTERYKLIHFYNDIDAWELYDLKKDPREMHNLFGKPGYEKITEKLKGELVKLQTQYDDPIESVQIVKKMFSKGLTPEEKIKLADEGPVCRLLLRQWDKFFGTSIENKKIEEEIWTNITDVCWNHKPAKKKLSGYNRGFRILAAAACLLLVVGTWYLITSRASLETIILGPADTRMTYVLPDSSVVWLAAGSTLSYQDDFLKERKVVLEGETSFEVKKMTGGSPFRVYFKDALVEVKGTEFNIKSDDEVAEVTLFTGKIDFQVTGQEAIEVKPAQRITYYIDSKTIETETLDIEGYDWRKEEYNFTDKPLGELINLINKKYHTKVCFENKKNRDNLFTGTIRKDEELAKVLRKISISFGLNTRQEKDTIILY